VSEGTVVIQTETTDVVETTSDEVTTVVVATTPVTETVEVNIGIPGATGPEGPQGETGATGPQGDTGPQGEPGGVTTFNGRNGAVTLQESDITTVNTFSQEFQVATRSATITHNLGCYPSVTVVNSAGDTVIADVQYVDPDNVVVSFSNENTFTVFCN
jgi:hypothetical protein